MIAHDLTLALGTHHVTSGQAHCNFCAQHGEDCKVPANSLGEGIQPAKAFGKIWRLQCLAMTPIYAFLSGISMTFTWKTEKPCKYSDWKKILRKTVHLLLCTLLWPPGEMGLNLSPWLQVETISLSSSQQLLSGSGLTLIKENSKSSVCTLELCPWKNHNREAHLCSPTWMLHPIPHWGLQGKVQVVL